jgi:hypothetical protein
LICSAIVSVANILEISGVEIDGCNLVPLSLRLWRDQDFLPLLRQTHTQESVAQQIRLPS